MTETVTIIDYGSGNLKSAAKAFERSARETGVDAEILVTDDPERVRKADRIVLPGVGAFADCRAGLLAVTGMRETLEERVIGAGVPFLGICVGQQLMAKRGLEKGVHEGFGWIDGDVRVLEPEDKSFKVPHMGWNTLTLHRPHALFEGIDTGPDGLHAYFVHSYHMVLNTPDALIATANYGMAVTAVVGRDNMIGTQFHPEKSQALGLAFIANFLRWAP